MAGESLTNPARFNGTSGISSAEFDAYLKSYFEFRVDGLTTEAQKKSDGSVRVSLETGGKAKQYELHPGYAGGQGANFLQFVSRDQFLKMYFGTQNKFKGVEDGAGYSQLNIDAEGSARIKQGLIDKGDEDVRSYLNAIDPTGGSNRPKMRIMYYGKEVTSIIPGHTKELFYPASPLGQYLKSTKDDYPDSVIDGMITSGEGLLQRMDTYVMRITNSLTKGRTSWLGTAGDIRQDRRDKIMNLLGIRDVAAYNRLTGSASHRYVAFSIFSDAEYKSKRKQLIKATIEAQKKYEGAKGSYGMIIDSSKGGWVDAKDAMESVQALIKLNRPANLIPPKKPDYRGVLKLRLENSQGLLVLAMKDIINFNGAIPNLKTIRDRARAGKTPNIPPGILKTQPECLNLYTGEPQSLVDLLKNPFAIDAMLCARPFELGYLQPMLQFYLDDAEDGLGNPRPVNFPDYTDGAQVLQLAHARTSTAQQVKNIFKSRMTQGTDVGVRSFSWSFDNKHRGDTTLKASLVLYFGNTNELLNEEYLKFVFGTQAKRARVKNPSKNNATAVQIKQTIDKRKEIIKKSDFYLASNPYSQDLAQSKALGTRPQNPGSKLSVKAGWAVPKDPIKNNLSKSFKDAVEESQRLINLYLYQYQVDFGEQGQATLSLDYVGGIDEFLGTPDKSNIFDTAIDQTKFQIRKSWVSSGLRLGEEASANPANLGGNATVAHSQMVPIAGSPKLVDAAWPAGYIRKQLFVPNNLKLFPDGVERVGLSKAGVMYEMKTLQLWKKMLIELNPKKKSNKTSEEIKKVSKWLGVCQSVMTEIERTHSDLVYSSFLNKLITSGKLYYATVNSGLVRGAGNKYATFSSQNQFGNRVTLGTTINAPAGQLASTFKIKVNGKPGSQGGVSALSDRLTKVIKYQSGANTMGNFANEARNFLDPTKEDSECLEATGDKYSTILYYIKLGDLLDIILCGLSKKQRKPIQHILGTFYPAKLGVPNFAENELASLRDIPISLEYFSDWYLKNFVSRTTKPRASYRSFVQSLLTELVAPMFNRVLRDNSTSNLGRLTFGFTPLVSSVDVAGNKNTFRMIDQVDLENIAKNRPKTNVNPLKHTEYYLIHAKQMAELNGNRFEDHRRGIYHLVLGSDTGLVKTFSFSQVDLPYYKEMVLEDGGFSEGLFLPQNVTITMVGNTYFTNGQTIFINADFGLGAAARKLGIGGYYTVTRVENYVENGKFETRLACQFIKKLE